MINDVNIYSLQYAQYLHIIEIPFRNKIYAVITKNNIKNIIQNRFSYIYSDFSFFF